MKDFKNKNKKGFTLIELLVVISIIGLLSSIVLTSLASAKEKARDAKTKAEVKQAELLFEEYYIENNGYPYTNSATCSPEPAGCVVCVGSEECTIAGVTITQWIQQLSLDTLKNKDLLASVIDIPGFTNIAYAPCSAPITNSSGKEVCPDKTGSDPSKLIYKLYKGPQGEGYYDKEIGGSESEYNGSY